MSKLGFSPAPPSGGVTLPIAESDVTGLVADLAALAPKASPALTGVPTAPTAAQGTSTTQLATTAMVQSEVTLLAPKANPTFTGTVTLPSGLVLPASVSIPSSAVAVTQAANDNSTKVATTAYADAADALKANIASPTFTGVPAAPTAAADTNTTQVATTANVVATATKKSTLTAKGSLYAASAASTPAELAVGTSITDRVIADSAAATGLKWVPHIVRRSADTATRASTTTLANDDATGGTLAWAIAASEVWSFMAVIAVTSNGGAGDFKCGWSVPASATMLWGALGAQNNNLAGFGPSTASSTPNALLTESGALSTSTFSGTSGVNLQGWVVNSTNAGTVTFQWAQVTSNAETILLKANSHLILWRLA